MSALQLGSQWQRGLNLFAQLTMRSAADVVSYSVPGTYISGTALRHGVAWKNGQKWWISCGKWWIPETYGCITD